MKNPYNNLNTVVLGSGISGVAAACLLLEQGARVTLLDECVSLEQSGIVALTQRGLTVLDTPAAGFAGFELCVASPGFKANHPWLIQCGAAGVPVISELQLGAELWQGKIMAVTGSKGKSTLVKLIAETLTLAGHPALPVGNYGIPLSTLASRKQGYEWAVVEVSSFQMEQTHNFNPDIAILLNLQADHLDRHITMAAYCDLKFKLLAGTRANGLILLPTEFMPSQIRTKAVIEYFGDTPVADWQWQDQHIFSKKLSDPPIELQGTWFDNQILGVAAAAATGALSQAGINRECINRGLAEFVPLPHRMQRSTPDQRGVVYINDSKSTTLTSLGAALLMTKPPLRLIAGGRLKEKEVGKVKELLTNSVKKVYLIGESSRELFFSWKNAVSCTECGTLEKALSLAVREADPGDTLLFSPGTASFDQYKNYQARGEQFMELVYLATNREVLFLGKQ